MLLDSEIKGSDFTFTKPTQTPSTPTTHVESKCTDFQFNLVQLCHVRNPVVFNLFRFQLVVV